MVKCLGICFSLCCALCSPPQRTHGGSNTAATIKREPSPRETRPFLRFHIWQGTDITFLRLFSVLGSTKKFQSHTDHSAALCTQWKQGEEKNKKRKRTLNSSLKSLPSSAERIRYSSSSESRGMGKYLLDGEGDLGRRTTVCSPV